jgi:hypothetical protein
VVGPCAAVSGSFLLHDCSTPAGYSAIMRICYIAIAVYLRARVACGATAITACVCVCAVMRRLHHRIHKFKREENKITTMWTPKQGSAHGVPHYMHARLQPAFKKRANTSDLMKEGRMGPHSLLSHPARRRWHRTLKRRRRSWTTTT